MAELIKLLLILFISTRVFLIYLAISACYWFSWHSFLANSLISWRMLLAIFFNPVPAWNFFDGNHAIEPLASIPCGLFLLVFDSSWFLSHFIHRQMYSYKYIHRRTYYICMYTCIKFGHTILSIAVALYVVIYVVINPVVEHKSIPVVYVLSLIHIWRCRRRG